MTIDIILKQGITMLHRNQLTTIKGGTQSTSTATAIITEDVDVN